MGPSKSVSAASGIDRRKFMAYFSGLGLASTLLPGILWSELAAAQGPDVTTEMIKSAQRLAALDFTDQECDMMARGLRSHLKNVEKLRQVPLDGVPPALQFNPILPGMSFEGSREPLKLSETPPIKRPKNLEDAAFWPVTHLAELIKTRQASSLELTQMYLNRLKRHNKALNCVVTFTEKRAMDQARQADKEIASGRYRGPLHGIPWGAKDLLAVKEYPTTWGATPYKDQVIDIDATVVERLDKAGAVLIAKLALGALAMGDVWFGGRTNNPWNVKSGSSGSSAGPAAATAAGLVGFSIGTETLGSIVSPATVCGVTALRPTFGRVSRHGAMALSWSMDKIGPMCRSVEDCAVVLDAIHGLDGRDPSLIDAPFNWDGNLDAKSLRVGYLKDVFTENYRTKQHGQEVLDTLTPLVAELVPIQLTDKIPVGALRFILNVEAAAAFDELTRSNRDDMLVRQVSAAWPNIFRQARFVSAVDYIQANRVRTLLMQEMAKVFAEVDAFVSSPYGGGNLLMTNLTGHPTVVLPNGFTNKAMPTSVTFTGNLLGEQKVLTLAKAYQDATGYHQKHPEDFT